MEKNRKKALLFALILSSMIIIILLAVYLGISSYFKGHYFPNTTLGALDCSGQTSQWALDYHHSVANDYLLTVYDRVGNKYHLKGMDFSYSYENLGEENLTLKNQPTYLWPMELSKEHSYPLEAGYFFNEDELRQQISALPLLDQSTWTAPENASIQITKEGYEIIPETPGNTPIVSKVMDEIIAAVSLGQTQVTLTDQCYESPTLTKSCKAITTAEQKIQNYMNATIRYEIENVDEALTSKHILSFLEMDEEFNVTVNPDKIDVFVQSLASKYNTYGDRRSFVTSAGDMISVSGGDYGWIIAKVKEAQQILIDLEGGVPVSRTPIFEQQAKVGGMQDIGDTYIEIDYTNQHMWYYEEGELILESDIVSGLMKTGNGSPDGIYKVVYKERNAKLQGEDYVTPVEYFIPFAYNVGFHDADWQSKFGEDVYTYNGSHGCINMPLESVAKLYESVEVGTPVVAYYREPVELTSESAKISNAASYVEPDLETD